MDEPTLESLRVSGALRHNPVRLRYLEVLAARLPGQPPRVREVLEQRLQHALDAVAREARVVSPSAAAPDAPAEATAPRAGSPLAALNREVHLRTRTLAEQARRDGTAGVSEMQSVREFSDVWARIHAEQQVTRALDQGPENAGPLNPHRLILRALSLMRELSPEYLRGFLTHAESLAWLEQANARPKSIGRAARPAKGAKPRTQPR